jgi:hypothetical protein
MEFAHQNSYAKDLGHDGYYIGTDKYLGNPCITDDSDISPYEGDHSPNYHVI